MDVLPSNCVPRHWAVEHGSTQPLSAECSLPIAVGRVSEAGCCSRACEEMLCSPGCCSLLQPRYKQVAGQHAAWSTIDVSSDVTDASSGCTARGRLAYWHLLNERRQLTARNQASSAEADVAAQG